MLEERKIHDKEENFISLLNLLNERKIDGFFIFCQNDFLNKFDSSIYSKINWATNFTGSNSLAIISAKGKSGFFTDGRYIIQASREINNEYFETKLLTDDNIINWLKSNLPYMAKLAYNSKNIDQETLEYWSEELEDLFEFIPQDRDFIDELWKDKPQEIIKKSVIYDEKYCGISYKEKISLFRKMAEIEKEQIFILTSPESICWLLNIRNFDLEYTPILNSYVIIYSDKIKIFVNCDKITPIIKEFYKEIEFLEIEEISVNLSKLKNFTIKIDPEYASNWFFNQLANYDIIRISDPIIKLKSVKNPTEIISQKRAHIYDAISMIEFLYWFENNVINSDLEIYEINIVEKLLEFRKKQPEFISLSFPSITGFGPNGAIIHYRADPISSAKITKNNLLLIDSGAQYYSGTTDVTRTIIIGKINDEQKRNYSLVLKSHIMLSEAKFPLGTTGSQLDVLARYYLWQENKDFPHATGHGVGCFLNVHEAPINIGKNYNPHIIRPNMILSIEPGYYKENQYGIRIENLVITVKDDEKFLKFENLTLVPIDVKSLDFSIINEKEKRWINQYHQRIFQEISPYINDISLVKWLEEICSPI